MDPVTGSFNIAGVAPEASIYMYRALIALVQVEVTLSLLQCPKLSPTV